MLALGAWSFALGLSWVLRAWASEFFRTKKD
jgi:hypothetical protein